MGTPGGARWNHNTHYVGRLLAAVPDPCGTVLDVGCGDGALLAQLARRAAHVVGIDHSEEMVKRARARTAGRANVEVVHGDFLLHAFGTELFDAVTMVASLHHLPFDAGVARAAALLRPGGVLAVVGLARSRSPRDAAYDAYGFVATRILGPLRGRREPGVPLLDPTMSYGQIEREARQLLPGVRVERLVLFRYLLTWKKPAQVGRGWARLDSNQ